MRLGGRRVGPAVKEALELAGVDVCCTLDVLHRGSSTRPNGRPLSFVAQAADAGATSMPTTTD